MGYYMRFYDTDPQLLQLADIQQALRKIDPDFDIDGGFLLYAGDLYAEIEIDGPDDRYFDWRVNSLSAECANAIGPSREKVEAILHGAQRMIFVRVLYGGREPEVTLSRLDTLWEWLFANRSGLLHAEGEGFYEDETLILAIK